MLVVLICAGCSQPTIEPTNTFTPTATFVPPTIAQIENPPAPTQATVTPQAYPYPYPTLEPDPYPPPVLTVTAEAYWSYWFTQTALPSPTREPTPTITPSPTITPTAELPPVRVTCSSDGKTSTCYDQLLRMRFEYPSYWGEIEAKIDHGWDSGYKYFYSFSNTEWVKQSMLTAGGRSHDFAEGREAFLTDFIGIPGELDCSSEHFEPGLCQQIAPQIILIYEFPQARWVCDPSPGTFYQPRAVLKINLPDNPVINGFVFATNFLSQSVQTELDRILNLTLVPGPPLRCDEAHQAAYDAKVQEIIEAIRAGDLDMESEKNLRFFVRLARSIQLK